MKGLLFLSIEVLTWARARGVAIWFLGQICKIPGF